MDKLAIVMGNYIDVDCDVNTTPRQAYERGFRRAFEKCETVMRSRKIENDQLKSENASLNGAAQGLGEQCDKYKAENAKLRELVRDVWDVALHPETFGDGSHLLRRMRDLGIEVKRNGDEAG